MRQFAILLLLHNVCSIIIDNYETPKALVEPLSPRGLRVSIPDSEGITLFAFHGKLNKEFQNGKEAGDQGLDSDVLRAKDGRWTFTNLDVQLKKNDQLNFWFYLVKDGVGYDNGLQKYVVGDLLETESIVPTSVRPPSTTTPLPMTQRPTPSGPCTTSPTTVNNEPVCARKLLVDANFTQGLDKRFKPTIQISDVNDEFVVYNDLSENLYFLNGHMVIAPTLLDFRYGSKYSTNQLLDLSNTCTNIQRKYCIRQAAGRQYLPPILSARVTTEYSFSFRYGIVEIKAKLPIGDWIVPEIWLVPRIKKYGEQNAKKIVIASSFGNRQLKDKSIETGNKHVFAGMEVGGKFINYTSEINDGFWGDEFHVFRMIWHPKFITFRVDDKEFGRWTSGIDAPFIQGSALGENIAPFNEEFYFVLGLQVGGSSMFPDDSVSRNRKKPWNNNRVNLVKSFYDELTSWYPTWSASQLKVEYVKVWSL